MTLLDLIIAFAVGLVIYVIWQTLGLHDRAVVTAKRHCARQGVQLLDDTVALKRLRPKRSSSGAMSISRCYEFEFTSTGERRYLGTMEMLGRRLLHIDLEPHQMPLNDDS